MDLIGQRINKIKQYIWWIVLCFISFLGSCNCTKKHADQGFHHLLLSVNQTEFQGDHPVLIASISNKSGEDIDLNRFRLKAEIQESEQSSGSVLAYTCSKTGQTAHAFIDQSLKEFCGKEELKKEDIAQVSLDILPGKSAHQLGVNLALVDPTTNQVISSQKATWKRAADSSEEKDKIALINVSGAINNQVGSFELQINHIAINPHETTIVLASSNDAAFQFVSNKSKEMKLADLLLSNHIFQKGQKIGPIQFQLEEDKGHAMANITVRIIQKKQVIGQGKVRWSKKDRYIQLEKMHYDPVTKKLFYQVSNQGKVAIEADDAIRLEFRNLSNNQVILKDKLGQELGFQGSLLIGARNQLADELIVDFKEAEGASFEWSLYDGKSLIKQKTVKCIKDVQLSISSIQQDLKNHTISYTIQNTGSDIANHVILTYQTTHKKASINGQHNDVIKGLVIPAQNQLSGIIGPIEFNGASSAIFDFELNYANQVVENSAQQISFVSKNTNPSLTLKYVPSTNKVIYQLTNTSGEAITPSDQLTLSYITTQGAKLSKRTNKTFHIKHIDAGKVEKGALKLDLNGQASTEITFTLKSGDEILATETMICQEEVPLAFSDASPVLLDEHTPGFSLNIDHRSDKKLAAKDSIQLQMIRIEGQHAIIQGAQESSAGIGTISLPRLANKKHIKLPIEISPGQDAVAVFKLQLLYREQPIGEPKLVTWKKIAHLKLKRVNTNKKVSGGDTRHISLKIINETSRDLALTELQAIKLHYTANGLGSLQTLQGEELQDKSLAALGITALSNEQEAKLDLLIASRDDSDFTIELTGKTIANSLYFPWTAPPKITLGVVDDQIEFGEDESQLILSFIQTINMGRRVFATELKKIKLHYEIEAGKKGVLQFNGKDAQGVDLATFTNGWDLTSITARRINLTFKEFEPGATKITCWLTGVVDTQGKWEITKYVQSNV